MPDSYNAIVSAVEPLTSGVVQLTLAVERRFSFAPGQSVVVHFPGCERTYCIASAPERPSAIQLCIRLGSGEGSDAVRGLVTGSSLTIDGPVGDFVMPADEKPLMLIGGDTGIAPIRSMVLHLAASGDKRSVTVFYEPSGEEKLYQADLRPLAERGRFVYAVGDVNDSITQHQTEIAASQVLAAGFEPFLTRVREALGKSGLGQTPARFETYGDAPH